MGASATNRFGRNGERYRPTKPTHSGKRGDERPRFGEAVQRVVLDIRTNDAADRSRKRSRRRKHRSPSSSRSSSSSRDRAKKDREEIARLKSLLAEKEAREQKREADCQRADAEAARKRELEEFKASVMALLPKPASPQIPGANAAAQSLFTVEGARRASYFFCMRSRTSPGATLGRMWRLGSRRFRVRSSRKCSRGKASTRSHPPSQQ